MNVENCIISFIIGFAAAYIFDKLKHKYIMWKVEKTVRENKKVLKVA